MLVRSLVTVLCLLVIPGSLGRHVHHQEGGDDAPGRIRKATSKSQKNQLGVKSDVHQPHLRFGQGLPPSISASEFGSTVLKCEAGGNPPPTIHWLKDGKRMTLGVKDSRQDSRDEDAEVEAPVGLGMTRSRLYLDCLSSGDEASYSCVAENAFLRIASDTKLVLRQPEVIENEETGASVELCLSKKAFGSPARIHMWTHTRLEVQGSDARLFCRSTGTPEPRILWVGPDDLPISSGDKYQVLSIGDLLIHDLTWEDLGSYTCLAENERGSDKTSTYLYPTAPENPN